MIVVVVVIGFAGIFLRFYGLSTRLFWADEVATAVRLSGYTFDEYYRQIYDGKIHAAGELREYLRANSKHGIRDVIASLAIEDPQHPPLYYTVAYYFARLFGSSPGQIRIPGAIFGALLPFALAWLCWELFGTAIAAAFGFALSAASPVLIIYSQQAREYGLWALLSVVSTAFLIRAARSGTGAAWTVYAISCIAGLYTDLVFILLMLGHAAYAAFLLRKLALRLYLAASIAAVVVFVPWIAVVAKGMAAISRANAWSAQAWPLQMIVEKWMFNLGTTFFDGEYAGASYAAMLVPIFLLGAYALYTVCRRGTIEQRLILAALILPSVLCIALPDLVQHQHRSTVTRYGMNIYLGLIIAVAAALSLAQARHKQMLVVAGFALVTVAFCCAIVDVRSTVWWDNHQNEGNLKIAAIVNSASRPLIVTLENPVKLLELAVYLNDDVHLQPVPQTSAAVPAHGYAPVFLFGLQQDAMSYGRLLGTRNVTPIFVAQETNAQIRAFRGNDRKDAAGGFMSLWRLTPRVSHTAALPR